ncbi:MAG: two-component system sensor histidine kinase NtrB [Myxococcota bacterium]
MLEGRRRWWGALIGAVGGLGDTALFLSVGIDLQVGGRDLTLPMALFMSGNFAVMGFLIGHFMDARARAARDAGTIRRQLDELAESQRKAAQNEKLAAIGRLAAGVAHEVRNPLGVIRASASMVQEGFDQQDEAWRACRFICEESDRLNALITSLLTFSRPTEPRFAPVHADKVLDRALELVRDRLRERRIQVSREDAGTVPALVADGDLLSQAVFDLLTNAVEAVADGGRLEVRLRAEPDRVEIDVADDGPGVAAADADQVFEPFFTTKASGTGLGLAMTARIAQAHGGEARLVDGAGAGPGGLGACFRLILPRRDADAAAA